MSLYVLDTDILTLFRRGNADVHQRVLATPPDELAITAVTVEEQLGGWYNLLRQARRPQQLVLPYQELAGIIPFLSQWTILPFSPAAATTYEQLLAMNLRVRRMDLRIAAIVLDHAATLVTRNLHDFQLVPGLTLENWAP
jgi:tRNA(fMet)-specific endonuclease VapC